MYEANLYEEHGSHLGRNVFIAIVLVVAVISVIYVIIAFPNADMSISIFNKPPQNTSTATTTQPTPTPTSESPKPIPKRLRINEELAHSDNEAFGYFIRSYCYLAGVTHVECNGDWAIFNVVGIESSGLAVYTFTVHDGAQFTLYGKTYSVSVYSYSTVDVSEIS